MSLASKSTHTYVKVPQVYMLEGPNLNAKVASEAIYAEEVEIIPGTKKGKWIQIQTCRDGYKGWIQASSIQKMKSPYLQPTDTVLKIARLRAFVHRITDTEQVPLLALAKGTTLKVVQEKEEQNRRWIEVRLINGKSAFIQRGDVVINPKTMTLSEMLEDSKSELNVPYAYGGTSTFGSDCSGFVQRQFAKMDIKIPRDSKDQIKWDGFKSIALEELEVGDSIFWGVSVDKIRHVGIYLGQNQFIHQTVQELKPYARISSLDDAKWNGKSDWPYRAARRLKSFLP